MKTYIAIAAAVFILGGCATSDTLPGAPRTAAGTTSEASAGISRSFSAPYNAAKAAALESVSALNVTVQNSSEDAAGFHINFSKPISAFSWGEVGRVDVVRADPGATVTVISSKRLKTQITGTTEKQFADQIFSGIEKSLARLGQ